MLQPVHIIQSHITTSKITSHSLLPGHSVKSHVTTSAQYSITCYNQCTLSSLMLQPVHSIPSQVTTRAPYPVTCYNQCTLSNHMLQPVNCIQSHVTTSAQYPITCYKQDTVSNHMFLNSHLPTKTCEVPRCVCSLYRPAHHTNWLQLLTPFTERSQLAHVHTCRKTVLYYTVVPLYTRRLILDRNMVLRLYTAKIISDILVKAHKSYFITQD